MRREQAETRGHKQQQLLEDENTMGMRRCGCAVGAVMKTRFGLGLRIKTAQKVAPVSETSAATNLIAVTERCEDEGADDDRERYRYDYPLNFLSSASTRPSSNAFTIKI